MLRRVSAERGGDDIAGVIAFLGATTGFAKLETTMAVHDGILRAAELEATRANNNSNNNNVENNNGNAAGPEAPPNPPQPQQGQDHQTPNQGQDQNQGAGGGRQNTQGGAGADPQPQRRNDGNDDDDDDDGDAGMGTRAPRQQPRDGENGGEQEPARGAPSEREASEEASEEGSESTPPARVPLHLLTTMEARIERCVEALSQPALAAQYDEQLRAWRASRLMGHFDACVAKGLLAGPVLNPQFPFARSLMDDPASSGLPPPFGPNGLPAMDDEEPAARQLGDLQGIPWIARPETRRNYRRMRLRSYRLYRNTAHPVVERSSLVLPRFETDPGKRARGVSFFPGGRVAVPHFQLRHLVEAVSKDGVFLLSRQDRVSFVDTSFGSVDIAIDLSGGLASCTTAGFARDDRWARYVGNGDRSDDESDTGDGVNRNTNSNNGNTNGNTGGGVNDMQAEYQREARILTHPNDPTATAADVIISTIGCGHGMLVAGGFLGEIAVKRLEDGATVVRGYATGDSNAITNAVSVERSRSGAPYLLCSSNDNHLRMFDLATVAGSAPVTHGTVRVPMPSLRSFEYEWPVNHASVRPGGDLAIVAGDDPDARLIDPRAPAGEVALVLRGHSDFTFSTAWHPGGHLVATGNQDCTARMWDVRMSGRRSCVALFDAAMGAARRVVFSRCGARLAVAEPADLVYVLDVASGLATGHVIDLFGEVGGVDFDPGDPGRIFVGISDPGYGGLATFAVP